MKRPRAKRSVTISGHRTSVSVEEAFWVALGEIAERHKVTVPKLATRIDQARPADLNLSSALRLFVLEWHRVRVRRLG